MTTHTRGDDMDKRLLIQAISKFTLGVALIALLLFLPAGTLFWRNGWLFMALLFIPMFCAGLVMMAKNPYLLRKRLDAKEKEAEQKSVLLFSSLMFLTGFVLAGLDFRFGWSKMPSCLVTAGAVIFLLAYLLYGEVLRENTYLSRTIEVQEGQKVIDTGLYGIVRHPMYAVTVFLFLSMPLVLGSWPALLVFLLYPVIIAKRIRNEEQVLEADLPGYTAYKQRVRYRLIPFIW